MPGMNSIYKINPALIGGLLTKELVLKNTVI